MWSGSVGSGACTVGSDVVQYRGSVRFSHSAVNSQTRSLRLWRQSTLAYCSQGVPQVFTAAVYRAHCAVIFAIAQLSCLEYL